MNPQKAKPWDNHVEAGNLPKLWLTATLMHLQHRQNTVQEVWEMKSLRKKLQQDRTGLDIASETEARHHRTANIAIAKEH